MKKAGSAPILEGFAREAVAFLDRSQDKPFFLYLAFTAPHAPYQAPNE